MDRLTATSLLNFDFYLIPRLLEDLTFHDFELSPKKLRTNVIFGSLLFPFLYFADATLQVPMEFRRRVVRRAYNPVIYLREPMDAPWRDRWILGRGKNKVVCIKGREMHAWKLIPYPTFSDLL